MDARQRQYLEAMGIPVWQRRDQIDVLTEEPVGVPGTVVTGEAPASLTDVEISSMDWNVLEQQVRDCHRCDLSQTRTQTVFGVGDRQADLMIIGEAPGADEDRQGEPFVGRAGQLLNAMLQAIDLQRRQVFIANILKCRPPNNRDPSAEEAAKCQDYLFRQIELVQPKLILVLGRIAAHRLLNTDTPLGKLRGELCQEPHSHTPMLITYHPAYLLRSPKEKHKAWQDLLLAKKTLQGIVVA